MYLWNVHEQVKRFASLALIFLVLITFIPADTFAAVNWRPGTKVYFSQGAALKGSDTGARGSRYFYNHSSKYTNRWPNSAGTGWLKEDCYALQTPLHSYTVKAVNGGSSKPAYCLEQNVRNPGSGNTKYTADEWKNSPFVGKLYSDTVQRGILLTLLYGRQPDSAKGDISKLFGVEGANLDDWYIATQALIWEYQQGLRTSASTGRKSYGSTRPDFFYSIVKNRKAGEIYQAMLKAMKKHEEVPSFSKKKNSSLVPIKLVFDENSQTWKSKVLTDRNNCMQALKVMASLDKEDYKENKKIKIVRQGETNQYVIETALSKDEWNGKSFRGQKNVPQITRHDLLTWNANDGTHYQTLATGADDPVHFYFKLTAEEAKEPEEAPEPELPSFTFDVEKTDKNPGFDQNAGTSHTGMGDAPLDSEISLFVDGMLEDVRQLDVNGHSDSPFYFVPWEDISQLEKQTVQHKSEDGNPQYTEYIYTGEKTVYTEETAVPEGRFSEEESGTGNGKRDHGTIKYWASCTDKPSGPEYRITYIGPEGREITVTEPDLVSLEEPLAMEDDKAARAYVNDHFRGKLQIVKSKDDQDPFTDKSDSDNGVKDYSTRSKWTIQLKSGGYEDHPYIRVKEVGPGESGYDEFAKTYRVTRDNSGTAADPENPLTVSKYGQIKVLDLPYGTYIVNEIAADAEGYVLESFEVTISSDGQLISTEVNNKPKSNRIKIVKTNSETGKTVRWDADRTAFRIRYKGNPDLNDPSDAENYDRYLPNGSSYNDDSRNYIFYADKNGEIILPYDIEYGIYEIEELVVPAGYYVGCYDESGKGTIADMGDVRIVNHQGEVVTPPKSFAQTVQVRDKKGNKVENFQGNSEITYNTYGFTVLEQDPHINGEDYIIYYAVIDMPNNPAKGKLEITKEGETLVGFNERKSDGIRIWDAVWGKKKLGNSKFEIYAAKDILQSDGVIPVKAFHAEDDKEIALQTVSRDHADFDGAKEIREYQFDSGEKILQTSGKEISSWNMTLTDYLVKAGNGATYEERFTVKDQEQGLTYDYTVCYKMNYAKGGFNYTDIHVTKDTKADDYRAEIPVTEPLLKSGDLEVGFVTMNYDGGNRVRMNRLSSEKGEAFSGVRSAYNTDDVTAVKVIPDAAEPVIDEDTGMQKTDEEGNPVFTTPLEVVRPAGWKDVLDEDGNPRKDCYLVTKDGEYQVFVRDGAIKRWIPCTKEGSFYKSYSQEYDLTAAQHFESEDGFSFSWDQVMNLTSEIRHEDGESVTSITGFPGTSADIKESLVYSHTSKDGVTVFTGKPADKAPVYFLTHDGIRTEMFLSGGLTHTRLTVTQSQMKKFSDTLPMIQWFNGDLGETVDWSHSLKPDNNQFRWIGNENNYVNADRVEAGPDIKEVYYVIDIVSDSDSAEKGFKITYPDSTQASAVVMNHAAEAKLSFASVDDTMVYPVGKPVEVITTGSNGVAESAPLPLGEYWVREIASAAGHVNRGQWKKMQVSYQEQYTPVIWDAAIFENEAVSVKIDLEKLFETDYQSGQYQPGSGAVFGIFTAEEMKGAGDKDKKPDKISIPADTLVGQMEVADGKGSITVKLPLGKYYIKETSAPQGYKTNDTKYYFDAVDVLTADRMEFGYKDIGVSGFLNQDGKNGVTLDFDTLYRNSPAKVSIDGKDYVMDRNVETDDVKVTVLDGRTNTQLRISDGDQSVISFENGALMTVKAQGQSYSVTLDGPRPSVLQAGGPDSENFTTTSDFGKTVICYQPKVTKTNWLSQAVCLYEAPLENPSEEEKDKKKILELTSPEKTSAVQAQLDYACESAMIFCPQGQVTGITHEGEAVSDLLGPLLLQRNQQVVIHFEDGVTFTLELDKNGNFYLNASGAKDGEMSVESTLTVDGKEELPKSVSLKNTTAKTYARNSSNGEVLNITIHQVKNDRLPEEPEEPGPPTEPEEPDTPDEPEEPDEPQEPIVPDEPETVTFLLRKISADTKEPLKGAEFEIVNEKYETIWKGKTDHAGIISVDDLPFGKYYYRETEAPAGYVQDAAYHGFYITEKDQTVEVVMENKMEERTDSASEIPKTGDSQKMTLYLAILLFAGGGLLVSIKKIK